MKKYDFLPNKQNKYSIRKFTGFNSDGVIT